MDDELTGEALILHTQHCDGCDECRGRRLTATEAREFLRRSPQSLADSLHRAFHRADVEHHG